MNVGVVAVSNEVVAKWLCVDELAQILDVSPATIQRWCRERRIPHVRVGRTIRFTPDQLARIESLFVIEPAPTPTEELAAAQGAALLGTAQVAASLGVSREQVWRLYTSGRLPGYRFDRRLRFTPADVQQFLDAHKKAPAARAKLHLQRPPVSRQRRSSSPPAYKRL